MRKSSLIIIIVLLGLFWAFVWPPLRMLIMTSHDATTFHAIAELRDSLQAYAKEHGRYPEDLSAIKLPELALYCRNGVVGPDWDKRHKHRRITGVELRPDGDLEKYRRNPEMNVVDIGKWIYDPKTGMVKLGCSGTDTKHDRPWYFY